MKCIVATAKTKCFKSSQFSHTDTHIKVCMQTHAPTHIHTQKNMYAKTWHCHTLIHAHTLHTSVDNDINKKTQLNPSLHKQTRLNLYNPESQWRTQSENEKAEHKAITGLCWPSQPKPKQLKSHRYLSPLSLPHSSGPNYPPLPNTSGETRKINPRKIHHSRHLLLFWAAIGCISCIRTKRYNSFFPLLFTFG